MASRLRCQAEALFLVSKEKRQFKRPGEAEVVLVMWLKLAACLLWEGPAADQCAPHTNTVWMDIKTDQRVCVLSLLK